MAFYNEQGEPVVPIFYNGVLISASPAYINFIGSGVIVTENIDGSVNVAISGGGGGGNNFSIGEVAAGATGNSFTIAHPPIPGTVAVYYEGQRLKVGLDYTISGQTITSVNTFVAGTVLVDYQY